MTTDNPHYQNRWMILAILGIAQLMVVLDATIVKIALPSAQTGASLLQRRPPVDRHGYALAFGSLLLLGGRLSDLFGRKWTFIAGLSGFAIASAVGGAAQSFGMLVAARAFQGAFGALLAPAALSLLTTTFTEPSRARQGVRHLRRDRRQRRFDRAAARRRAHAVARAGASCMYVNLVFAAVAVAGALTLVHNHAPATRPRLDIPGTLAVSGGLFALVYGFSHAQTTSWRNHLTIGCWSPASLLLALFVAIERRATNPLLPLRVLADRNRGASFLSIGISGAAIFGVFLFLTYYLQQTPRLLADRHRARVPADDRDDHERRDARHDEAPRTLRATTAGRHRHDTRARGMLYLTRIGVSFDYAGDILPALVVIGVGLGLVISTSISNATLGVEPNDAGVASATVNASQQIGGSLGTSLLSTIAASAATRYLAGTRPSRADRARRRARIHDRVLLGRRDLRRRGAIVAAVLFERRVPSPQAEGQPVLAH